MSEATLRHMDCRNYAAVDAFKGICHRTCQVCPAGDPACEQLVLLARCKHCAHYAPSAEAFLGRCRAEAGEPMTYPDLAAVNCEQYRAA